MGIGTAILHLTSQLTKHYVTQPWLKQADLTHKQLNFYHIPQYTLHAH